SLDAKRGDRVAGPRPRRAPVDDAVAHEALCARREQRVVGQRELGDGTAALALFGHVGEATASARVVRSPESAARSSRWPLPEMPAMPTISPALTSRSTPASGVPNGSP